MSSTVYYYAIRESSKLPYVIVTVTLPNCSVFCRRLCRQWPRGRTQRRPSRGGGWCATRNATKRSSAPTSPFLVAARMAKSASSLTAKLKGANELLRCESVEPRRAGLCRHCQRLRRRFSPAVFSHSRRTHRTCRRCCRCSCRQHYKDHLHLTSTTGYPRQYPALSTYPPR